MSGETFWNNQEAAQKVINEANDIRGKLEPLARFTTNPAGSAIVNAVGPIRQIVRGEVPAPRRYLVIVSDSAMTLGKPVQVQGL